MNTTRYSVSKCCFIDQLKSFSWIILHNLRTEKALVSLVSRGVVQLRACKVKKARKNNLIGILKDNKAWEVWGV